MKVIQNSVMGCGALISTGIVCPCLRLRSKHIFAVFLSHMYCNVRFLGLRLPLAPSLEPLTEFLVSRGPKKAGKANQFLSKNSSGGPLSSQLGQRGLTPCAGHGGATVQPPP